MASYYTSKYSGEEIDALLEKANQAADPVEIVNSLTQTTPGKALDAAQGKVLDGKIAAVDLSSVGGSGRNLLDNWDFRNPVNQRGQTSWESTGDYYCVDRWKIYNPNAVTVTLNESGIGGVANWFTHQEIENQYLYGKPVTASVRFADGLIITGTGIIPPLGGTSVTLISGASVLVYLESLTACGYPSIAIKSLGTGRIQSVKLELGSVSTLVNDPPADYGEELRKCQRYYYKFSGFFFVPSFSNRECYGNFMHPVYMRTTPAISGLLYDTDWGTPNVSTITNKYVIFHNVSVSPIITAFEMSADL